MFTRLLRAAPVGVALLVLPSGCAASPVASPDYAVTAGIPAHERGVHVRESWTPAGRQPQAPVFLTIVNRTHETVGLVGVEHVGPARGAIRQVLLRGGHLRDAAAERSLRLPPGSTLSMGPRTTHVRLTGLTRARRPGGELRLRLRLSDGSTVPVRVPVKTWAGAPR